MARVSRERAEARAKADNKFFEKRLKEIEAEKSEKAAKAGKGKDAKAKGKK